MDSKLKRVYVPHCIAFTYGSAFARASALWIRHRARGKGDDEKKRSKHKPWDDVRNTV